jgi:hypothetical protein
MQIFYNKMTKKGKGKKQKVEEEEIERNPNSTFYSDTSYKIRVKNCMEWSEIYNFIEDGNFTDEYESDADDFEDVKRSILHKITSRPTILPYYDMVQWIISHTDISTCTIVNYSRQVIGSFRPEDISNMYKLEPTKVNLDENFIEGFIEKEIKKEEVQMVDLIRDWWHDSSTFKIISDKIYPIQKLKKPPMLVATMLCRLYGEKDSLKFKLGWVPLIHQILKGKIFNWAHILSANIQQEVKKSQEAPPGYCLGFFYVWLFDRCSLCSNPFSIVILELVNFSDPSPYLLF